MIKIAVFLPIGIYERGCSSMKNHIHQQLNDIVKNYFLCKKQFSIMSFSSGQINYSNPYYIYYRDVEIALQKLEDEERLIIKNDYFNDVPRLWWRKFFSHEEYSLFKRAAIKNFVRLFHEIHY